MATPGSLRKLLYQQLEAPRVQGRGLSASNWAILFLILFSLVIYTAETERELNVARHASVQVLNIAILIVFGLEFTLRLYAAGVQHRYRGAKGMFAYLRANWFMMVIDFLAFAPELLLIVAGIYPPGWLRMLRVIRVFKIARYFPAFRLVVDAVRSCIQELLAALAVAMILWYLASALLYLAEGDVQPEAFGSITRAMWWSVVTLTTVGYGDSYPITVLGKVLAGFIAVLGLGAVALPSGILAGAFMDKLREARAQKHSATNTDNE